MIKSRKAAFILFVVLFMAFWNLLDLLCTKFITKGTYSFAASSDLAVPLVVAAVLGYLLYLKKKD